MEQEDDESEEPWEEEFQPGFEPVDLEFNMSSPRHLELGPSQFPDSQTPDTSTTPSSREAFIPRILQNQPLSAAIKYRLAERKVFVHGSGPRPPEFTARIPVSLWIFGIKLNGILDTGSERSYINAKVYEDIREYASGELRPDETQKRGVLLANHTLCKSLGGAPFIIQIDSVAGEQYLSVIEDLGYSVVLGMDFALQFGVIINSKDRTWQFSGNNEVHPFEFISCKENATKCSSMSADQELDFKNFIELEMKKFEGMPNQGLTNIIEHEIVLKPDANPVRIKPYRRSPVINEELNRQIDELLKKNFIRPSYSVWSCSPVMVAKPNKTWRFCVDYRPINRVTIPPAHPLPNMLRILSALHGAVYISTMDLKEAFHQIRMAVASIPLTAFSVEGRGQFEWLRMPYGLVGAPSTFQKAMDELKERFHKLLVERNLPTSWADQVFAYLDDWIVISETMEEHKQILALVFEVFRDAGLLINPEKCKFCRPEVKFLGFLVNKDGLHTDPDKIAPIVNYPRPTNRKQLRSFLGLVNWYHRHLQNVAKAQGPLNKLTGVTTEWKWGPEEEESFNKLKRALIDAQPLSVPKVGLPYYLYTDACDTGLGAFLVQRDPETHKEYLIICLSRQLKGAETRYTTTEKECLAVVWAVRKLRCYLEGTPFTVVTDHAALKWLHSLRDPNGRLARWAMELLSHQITIEHRRGTENEGPDALSRIYEENTPEDWLDIKGQLESNHCLHLQVSNWYAVKFNNVRRNPGRFPDWRIVEDRLEYHRPDPLKSIVGDDNAWKVVLQDPEIQEVLKKHHEDPDAAHLGRDRMYERIKVQYYWPGMYQDVDSYVEACEVCKQAKYKQSSSKAPMQTRQPIRPWAIVAADVTGPFTRSRKGHQYILVIQDLYTRFIELYPLRRHTGAAVLEAFKRTFSLRSYPLFLVTDNGREFVNETVQDYLKSVGVKFTPLAVAHPQANPVERINRTIKPMIRSYINKDQTRWDDHLGEIQLAYNSSYHTSLKLSPYFLVHGQEPRLSDKLTELEMEDFIPDNEEWKQRVQRLDELRHKIESIMRAEQERQATYKSPESKIPEVKLGDRVFYPNRKLSNKSQKYSAGLGMKYLGPATVKKIISPLVVELSNDAGKSLGTHYTPDLKLPRRSTRIANKTK
ncbi:retrovirus-related Pol polyprotein from transposon 297 [Microplitis demolitor]|uniref:retrovirus-related Pol polyprotein from transposon 297 n=1 Tax=Microplitis demolitor TaxID=69319 RepID=UPI00235B6347|nr:retrovirus-related Pol polyprotein from transposon 297 [Microplitis demolitor]